MSRQKIVDLCAAALVVIFLIGLYTQPVLKDYLLGALCVPESLLLRSPACGFGLLLLYMIPFFSASWLVLRGFVKITKFASLIEYSSRLQKGMRAVYEKVRLLDG